MNEKLCFTGEPRSPGGRDPDICVVTCAVNGLLATRKQCAGIPYTPVEIAEEARRAYEAGAAVVHIHARNDDGSSTASPAVFARIKEEVRRRCPIILNFSTGTILEEVDEQCTYIRESRPEIASLNLGTMNYSKYSRARKSFDFDMVFPNTYKKIGELLSAMNGAGVKPELECFDSGHTQGVWPLIDMGLLKPPLDFSFIVNVLGGARRSSSRFSSRSGPCRPARSGGSSVSATGSGGCWRRRWCSAGTSAAGSRTTSICRTARWRATTARSSIARCS